MELGFSLALVLLEADGLVTLPKPSSVIYGTEWEWIDLKYSLTDLTVMGFIPRALITTVCDGMVIILK